MVLPTEIARSVRIAGAALRTLGEGLSELGAVVVLVSAAGAKKDRIVGYSACDIESGQERGSVCIRVLVPPGIRVVGGSYTDLLEVAKAFKCLP